MLFRSSVTHYHFLMICVSVQRVLYLNAFSQIHHSSVLSLDLASKLALVTQLLLEMSCFCVLNCWQFSEFVQGRISLSNACFLLHFCDKVTDRDCVQLSHYWIS